MTPYRKWLLGRLDEIASFAAFPDECRGQVLDRYAEIIQEAGEKAARLGLPQLFERAQHFRRITRTTVKAFLAECLAEALAALDQQPASHLTVAEAARHLRVKTDTIRSWINAGRLNAANTGQGSRPRWRIAQADLDLFLAGRTRQPRGRQRRKAPPPSPIRYFPEA
jgi:excisionase family DNA binding protein